MWQQPDIATCSFFPFSSFWLSVFRLNRFQWVFCLLLLGSCLSVSCARAHVHCKSFTVLRFPRLCLCNSWPVSSASEVFSQGLTADSDGLYGFVSGPLHPGTWWLMGRPVCKRALISSLSLLQEILRGVSFLNKLKAAFNISLAFLQKRGSHSGWMFQRRGWNAVSVPKHCDVRMWSIHPRY